MKRRIHVFVLAVPAMLLFLSASGCVSAKGGTVAAKRGYVRDMRISTLEELQHRGYREQSVEGSRDQQPNGQRDSPFVHPSAVLT